MIACSFFDGAAVNVQRSRSLVVEHPASMTANTSPCSEGPIALIEQVIDVVRQCAGWNAYRLDREAHPRHTRVPGVYQEARHSTTRRLDLWNY
jgi:hypothetical protein